MSYLGRIAGRLTESQVMLSPSPAPGVMGMPTVRFQSPIVAADQRLSLDSFARIVPGSAVKRRSIVRSRGAKSNAEDEVKAAPETAPEVKAPMAEGSDELDDRSLDAADVGSPDSSRVREPLDPSEPATLSALQSERSRQATERSVHYDRASSVVIANAPLIDTSIANSSNAGPSALRRDPSAADGESRADVDPVPGFASGSQAQSGKASFVAALAKLEAWLGADAGAEVGPEEASPARLLPGQDRHHLAHEHGSERRTELAQIVAAPLERAARRMSAPPCTPTHEGDVPSSAARTGPNAPQSGKLSATAELRALPLPHEALHAPVAAPAPILSIGRIEVEVVLPQKAAIMPVAPPARAPAVRASRVASTFETPHRAFGWRQS